MARLRDEDLAAVLLDLAPGKENGWEILRQVRLVSSVPVIMMSALAVDDDMAMDARHLGAQGIVEKPFAGPEVAARLRRLVG